MIERIGKGLAIAGLSVGVGSLVTYLSKSYAWPSDSEDAFGVELQSYGYPFAWLLKRTVIYPGSPTTYSVYTPNLLKDLALWTVIAAATFLICYAGYRWYRSRRLSEGFSDRSIVL